MKWGEEPKKEYLGKNNYPSAGHRHSYRNLELENPQAIGRQPDAECITNHRKTDLQKKYIYVFSV